MKPPRFLKPAKWTQRALTLLIVLPVLALFVGPFAGILGHELIVLALVCVMTILLSVLTKLVIHLVYYIRRHKTPAGPENESILKAYLKAQPSTKAIRDRLIAPGEPMTWGHCVAFRKQVYAAHLRERTDRLLASLERLGII